MSKAGVCVGAWQPPSHVLLWTCNECSQKRWTGSYENHFSRPEVPPATWQLFRSGADCASLGPSPSPVDHPTGAVWQRSWERPATHYTQTRKINFFFLKWISSFPKCWPFFCSKSRGCRPKLFHCIAEFQMHVRKVTMVNVCTYWTTCLMLLMSEKQNTEKKMKTTEKDALLSHLAIGSFFFFLHAAI